VLHASPRSHGTASAPPADIWPRGLELLAQVALPDFLLRQRWYPGKDAGRPAAALSTLLPFPVSAVPAAVAVWRVTPPGHVPVLLFVPLALVPLEAEDPAQVVAAPSADTAYGCGEVRLVEAFSVDAFVRAWIDTLLRGDGELSQAACLRTGRTEQLPRAWIEPAGGWAIRRSSAEQSNTSIRIGDGAILKVLRKLEDGIHPELEVSRFLTETAGFAGTPPLLGWAELDGASSGLGPVTLAILQAFVPNEGDGWSWVLERLARAADPGTGGTEALDEATSWLRRLSRRTAELHAAFGSHTNDPACRPELVESNDIQRWAAAAQATARRALDDLAGRTRLDPQARRLASALLARRDEVVRRVQALDGAVPAFTKTRHHGDYHLGQLLVTGRDGVIIDFESEPPLPLAKRRAKHAALRDVAGMLRSSAYAAAAAERALPPDMSGAEQEAVQRRLAAWEAEASQVDAYFEAARGGSFCPADRADADRVVRFFMLEKALYEISYELANRPDWVAIPLRGVLALLDAERS
jgi:trehalose synthase-fused probable maltokinase